MRLLVNTPTLTLPDMSIVAPMQEPRTSWAVLFFDTYFSDNINGDPQAAHHYFDAIFDSVDWQWEEDRQKDVSDLIITHITQTYLTFEQQLNQLLPPEYRDQRHRYRSTEVREITQEQVLVELQFQPG